MAYRAADNPDRIKALGGVAVVHAGLAAIILSGLTVHTVSRTVERLKTFDIREVPPPPHRRRRAANARARQGTRRAPRARRRCRRRSSRRRPGSSCPTSRRSSPPASPSTGSAATAGAATAGNGTGAGGSGNGLGGGGSGDFSGFTPAQRISQDPEPRISPPGRPPADGAMAASAITLRVNTDGSPSNCRIVRSSGDGSVDSLMCRLALQYVRFRPARDTPRPRGRPGHHLVPRTGGPNF